MPVNGKLIVMRNEIDLTTSVAPVAFYCKMETKQMFLVVHFRSSENEQQSKKMKLLQNTNKVV